jgi:hypothetical protein
MTKKFSQKNRSVLYLTVQKIILNSALSAVKEYIKSPTLSYLSSDFNPPPPSCFDKTILTSLLVFLLAISRYVYFTY